MNNILNHPRIYTAGVNEITFLSVTGMCIQSIYPLHTWLMGDEYKKPQLKTTSIITTTTAIATAATTTAAAVKRTS